MDIWGHIFRDEFAGRRVPHVIERDDGREETFDSAAGWTVLETQREGGHRVQLYEAAPA